MICIFFFFSSRRRHTRCYRDWSSDVCSSDLLDLRCPARLGPQVDRGVEGGQLAAGRARVLRDDGEGDLPQRLVVPAAGLTSRTVSQRLGMARPERQVEAHLNAPLLVELDSRRQLPAHPVLADPVSQPIHVQGVRFGSSPTKRRIFRFSVWSGSGGQGLPSFPVPAGPRSAQGAIW